MTPSRSVVSAVAAWAATWAVRTPACCCDRQMRAAQTSACACGHPVRWRPVAVKAVARAESGSSSGPESEAAQASAVMVASAPQEAAPASGTRPARAHSPPFSAARRSWPTRAMEVARARGRRLRCRRAAARRGRVNPPPGRAESRATAPARRSASARPRMAWCSGRWRHRKGSPLAPRVRSHIWDRRSNQTCSRAPSGFRGGGRTAKDENRAACPLISGQADSAGRSSGASPRVDRAEPQSKTSLTTFSRELAIWNTSRIVPCRPVTMR